MSKYDRFWGSKSGGFFKYLMATLWQIGGNGGDFKFQIWPDWGKGKMVNIGNFFRTYFMFGPLDKLYALSQ